MCVCLCVCVLVCLCVCVCVCVIINLAVLLLILCYVQVSNMTLYMYYTLTSVISLTESLGQRALVGKVNMDQESPDYYVEETQKSVAETRE